MKTKRNNKKGFTIVELVIVIAVIAILAAVLIPTFSSIVQKAKESSVLQAARNEMIEIKASLISTGNDLPDGTVFGDDDVYYEYRNGELTKTTKPEGTLYETKLNGVSIWSEKAGVKVGFEDTDLETTAEAYGFFKDNRNIFVKISFAYTQGTTYTINIKNSSGVSIYNETSTNSGRVYFSMYYDGEDQSNAYTEGNATSLTTQPSADYYYYTVKSGDTLVASGVFYYG